MSRARIRPVYAIAFTASLLLVSHLVCLAAAQLYNPLEVSRSGLLREVLDPVDRDNTGVRDGHTICRPTGQIQDACTDYESVERFNDDVIWPRLNELRQSGYFRYFYVDLFKDCPFWNDDGLCMNRACAVEKVEEQDIPEQYRSHALGAVHRSEEDNERGFNTKGVNARKTDFCYLDDEVHSSDAVYVDLMKNPERFTGYAGASANRVWRSIYEENCFGTAKWIEPPRSLQGGGSGFISPYQIANSKRKATPPTMLSPARSNWDSMVSSIEAPVDTGSTEQCLEKRVFYRVISGLHASISIHICDEFLDQQTGKWGPNLECFISRISQHPERLQNVFFDYALLLRALAKAGEYLDKFELLPGDEIRDQHTKEQLRSVLQVVRDSQPSFDERHLFNLHGRHDAESLALKEDFRQHFMNISRIMDCVGCDKCRLWGKVQITGIGTALKLLFSFDAASEYVHEQRPPLTHSDGVTLRRSELVALINTAYRFSESVRRAMLALLTMADQSTKHVPRSIPKYALAARSAQGDRVHEHAGLGEHRCARRKLVRPRVRRVDARARKIRKRTRCREGISV